MSNSDGVSRGRAPGLHRAAGGVQPQRPGDEDLLLAGCGGGPGPAQQGAYPGDHLARG